MNQNQRSYTQVGSSSSNNPRWEPTKNAHNPAYPMALEGYFVKLREIQGANGIFQVAEIQQVNEDGSLGQCVDVSGGKVLDDKLRTIPLGSFIMIKFGGKQPSKTPGRTYNVWETYIDENAVPFHALGGVTSHQSVQAAPAPAVSNVPQQQQAPFQNTQPFGNVPPQQQVFPNNANHPFGNAPQQQVPFGGNQQQTVAPAQPFGGENPFLPKSDLPF